ncbi:hypothetical protein E4T38_00576 [Aureobasidium subglaciale]|nr:hypothetical protein E4T38_00576 [Aureobasidium subglaciale]KAI5231578.1 hypothetical protein E4T40_00327 [Aureobasidium subglaciale]KAI5234288.1 hypothetical protein E4T41_00575 [Aureobasidium subglaciale]KAI5267933.1 hypothetical protein E4T46_00575 [Aureobasidium subglaciale]
MATFFNFDQYSEGALSISSTALRVDAPIGTFSSNANPYEPGSFLNGITSFRPNYNVYILHDSGAAHGASQRNCVISFTVPNQTTFSRLSLDIQHNSGSPGLVAPISIAFEASTTVDFQNATQLGTLDSVFSGPEVSGDVHFRLRCTSPIPDGSNYISYANVRIASYSEAVTRSRLMTQWHKYFVSGLHFTLSFTDRDHASLGMATPDERNPGSQIAYLTPDCVAMFSFEAVDQLDYNQGYRIISDSKYVGPMDIFRRSDCISFVAEANRALIFLPDFSDTLTFVLRNIADGQLLTRPWDYTVDIGLQSRCAVVLAQLNSPLYGATQQIFRMPAWALREAQMANLPSDLRVIVSSSGRCLYANGDQLAWGMSPQSDAAVVSFIAPELTSIHAGYLLVVGGKYVKMTSTDVVLGLTTNMADATHICVNATANGTLSFWMCQSDYVLAPNNDTPVFTVCDDPRAVVPTWQILEPEVHVEQTMVVNDSPGAIHTLSNTTYIKAIVQRLNRTSLEKEGSLWNYSFDNALPADWLIITPEHCFDPYSTFEMRIPADGANDFNLKSCDGSSPDPTHPCVSLASSVSVPGGTPLKLHAGHSRRIYEEMYNHIISGRHFIDIASLLRKDATPSGEFLAAVRNAITRLSKTAEAMNVVIRLIFGEPLGWAGDLGLPFIPGTGPYRAAPALLLDLVRDVPSDTYSQMQIYLAYTSSAASLTWNHSKIVAVDGQRALVGGHNMWDGAYLGDNPVLDVSMKTEGLSAVDAHRFAENLWFDQVIAHGDYWAADAAAFRPGLPNRIVVGQRSVPPPRLFASFYPGNSGEPGRYVGRGIPILSVGREEGMIADSAPSDIAFVSLLNSATESIYISAQAMSHAPISGRNWLETFLNGLAEALKRGVTIALFLSNPASGAYEGDSPVDVLGQIQARITGRTNTEINSLMRNIAVRSLPSSTTWGLANQYGISNHAKVILVDKKAFSIGSQNYYPSTPATMSEFSYIVEDTTAAQLLYDTYMSKMEAWALPSPTPLSLPDLTSYVVTITNIWCQQTSAGPGEDQIYLERAGSRIWPQNSWYETFTPLRSSVVSGVDLPAVRTIDNPQFVRLMEWDYIADDILTQVSFHPNQVLSCKTGAEELKSKKLSDLVPEVIYRTYGDMRDDRAVYTLAFKFSKVPQPNPS